MQFTTLSFAWFFLATLTVSWMLRRVRTAQKVFLLVASCAFYAGWDLRLLGLLAGATVANWAFAHVIARARRLRRFWLVVGLVANVGYLGFFKYYGFFQEGFTHVAQLLGLSSHLPILELLLPLGISFYTFQNIAWLVDVYRAQTRPAKLLDFALFVSFFPKFAAGPICRTKDLLPQIEAPAPERIDVSRAAALIASGLFKKVFIASFLATRVVEDCFVAPENYGSLELVVALFAYSVQVFCDFSGYSDLARGLAILLGFELPENFDSPYAATNIGDFWRRWHMSLSTWLREYLYFPLGGSRGGTVRTCVNLMITFVLSGLWHGASWNFVIWGAIHGAALCVHKLWRDHQRARGQTQPSRAPLFVFASWFVTFNLCVFARVFFKAPDLATALAYFEGLGGPLRGGAGVDLTVLAVIALGLSLNFVGRPLQRLFVEAHVRLPWVLRPVAWTAVALVLFALEPADVAPYIYFQF